jgi:ABC-2 type transport system permease protein
MSATTVAVRAGLQRGAIETRQILTNPSELLGWLWPSIIALVVLYTLSGNMVPGTSLSVGSYAIPGVLGMNLVMTGLLGLAAVLTMEREDGTLLRMKATPNGMIGYLVGKVISQASMTVAMIVLVLIPASFIFEGLELRSVSSWFTLAWVLALGLTATLPIGAIVGSWFRNAQSLGFVTLLITGVVGISGVFYPLTVFPVWLQWVGQAFPIYWLGLGMRSALLPDALAAAEVGGSWRYPEMIGALVTWTIIGFAGAPVVLRRMARRQSGSRVSDGAAPTARQAA